MTCAIEALTQPAICNLQHSLQFVIYNPLKISEEEGEEEWGIEGWCKTL
jgi:hypothetical protein